MAYGWLRLADSHYRQARYDAAEQDIRQAQAILDKLPNCTRNHGRVNTSLGMIFVKTGRLREAEPLLGKGLAIAEQKSPRQSNYVAAALGGLGECLTAAKRYAEAEPHLIESYKTIDSLHVPKSPTLKEARGRLVTLYHAWGRSSEAARYVEGPISAGTGASGGK